MGAIKLNVKRTPIELNIQSAKLLEGIDGKSAYELYVEQGGTLTPQQWLDSLKGPQGVKGDAGERGPAGYTPVKGVDYFTAEEQAEIDSSVQSANAAANLANAAARAAECFAIVCEADGTNIHLTDSANAPVRGLTVYGKSEQFTTTGKNKANFPDATFTANGVSCNAKGGCLTFNGTASTAFYGNNGQIVSDIPVVAGNYIVSGYTSNVSFVCKITKSDNGTVFKTNTMFTLDGTELSVELYPKVDAGKTLSSEKVYPMLELGSAATAYEPYTGGIASPNPDYPQEIVSVGDSGEIEVRATGKNILEYPYIQTTKTQFGITYTDNGDGTVTANGTSTGSAYFILSNADRLSGKTGTYTLSGGGNGIEIVAGLQNKQAYDTGNGVSFDIATVSGNIAILVREGTTVSNVIIKPQLERGLATSYEPYRTTTATLSTGLPLRGIPVSSGGNVVIDGQQYIADTLECNGDGTGQIVKRVNWLMPTGASIENWTIYPNISSLFYCNNLTYKKMKQPNDNSVYGLCSHYQVVPGSDLLTSGNYKTRLSTGENTTFYIRNTDYDNDLDGFKQHLANEYANDTPVIAMFELVTPEVIPLTAEEVQAVLALQTYKPVTNLHNDAGAYQSVTYVADPKTYIDNKFSALAAAIVDNA